MQLLQDPMMVKLLEVGQRNQDGSRSFRIPGSKKQLKVDLTKLTETERVKLHRKLMKAQAGRGDSESSEEELPEYMFPESDAPLQDKIGAKADIKEEKKSYEK